MAHCSQCCQPDTDCTSHCIIPLFIIICKQKPWMHHALLFTYCNNCVAHSRIRRMWRQCWVAETRNHFNYLTELQVSAVQLQKPAAMQNITAHTNVCCVSSDYWTYLNKRWTYIDDPLHNLQLPEKYLYRAHLTLCTVMRGGSAKVSDARGATSGITCPNLFIVPWDSVYRGVQLGKHSGLHCIQFKTDDSFWAVSKCIKQWAGTEGLMQENETSIGIHWCLLAFYGEGIVAITTVPHWVRKSW
jgi:hypothetical protein